MCKDTATVPFIPKLPQLIEAAHSGAGTSANLYSVLFCGVVLARLHPLIE
jgi:hypothetical protein